MRPDDVLAALRDDIERVRIDSRWTYFDGHLPRGPNPDRVAGIEARDQFGRDREDEPERDPACPDIGVGAWRSRKGYRDSAWPITFLDMRLFATLTKLGQDIQPPYGVINTASGLAEREHVLLMACWRVERIAEVWDDAPRSWQKHARIPLADAKIKPPSARAAADEAVRILSRALSAGSTGGMATAEKLCEICKLRPQGDRTGKRCERCHSWRLRNRGEERPRSIDALELAGPLAAKARRDARGEGYGSS